MLSFSMELERIGIYVDSGGSKLFDLPQIFLEPDQAAEQLVRSQGVHMLVEHLRIGAKEKDFLRSIRCSVLMDHSETKHLRSDRQYSNARNTLS